MNYHQFWKFGRLEKEVHLYHTKYTINFHYDGEQKRLVFSTKEPRVFFNISKIDDWYSECLLRTNHLYHEMEYYYSACETVCEKTKQRKKIRISVDWLFDAFYKLERSVEDEERLLDLSSIFF